MEGMMTWELTHLSLSYSNILEIDNLGGMTNLKELRLDNNIITRI
jgi:Leucine-rich repeat (LRR) protein